MHSRPWLRRDGGLACRRLGYTVIMGTGGERTSGGGPRSRAWPRIFAACLSALLAALLAGAWAQPAAAADPPAVQAPSAIIIDSVTGRVLYGQDIHHERPMASTTKIMTALLVVQRARYLSTTITAPAAVASTSGIGLRPGERITIKEALLGLAVKSAQDCGLTLATAIAGNEPAFVRLMNAKARRLGLRDTHYENSTGSRRDPRHHSSVFDLAKLGRTAMRNARFRDLVRRQRAVIHWGVGRQLAVRSNNLLLSFAWADGVKCGYTPAAGFCLVGSGQPGLRPFITASLDGPSRDQDARDHVALFEWASTLYAEKTVVSAGDEVAVVPVSGGGEVHVAALSTLTAVVRSAAAVLPPALTLPNQFAKPPADGKVVGTAVYRADGVVLGSVKLIVFTPAAPAQPGVSSPSPVSDASSGSGTLD
jgi:D-alanyl-D-alanine carboxypeptidase (penicillin-binding protein 5/6)